MGWLRGWWSEVFGRMWMGWLSGRWVGCLSGWSGVVERMVGGVVEWMVE